MNADIICDSHELAHDIVTQPSLTTQIKKCIDQDYYLLGK